MTHADELNEWDNDPPAPWPPPERRIQTQPYDLSINTLIEQWDDGDLIIPEFQREYVWDDSKASRLIESLLLNIPIPVLYFSETPDAKYEIVDGHQRVNSIVRYVKNSFPLKGLRIQDEFRGLRFDSLPKREQRFLKSRTMRVIVITAESHPDMKFEVFERLNTGSVALNAQEIRRAVYRGPTTKLLDELVQNRSFRLAIGRKSPRPRFVDQELVLRFLAMRANLGKYRPPLLRFLNEYLRSSNSSSSQSPSLQALADDFSRAADLVYTVFRENSFRLLDARGESAENNINRALFETEMLVLASTDPDEIVAKVNAVRQAMADLCQNSTYLDTVQRATGDRSRTFSRIMAFANSLSKCGFSVDYTALGLSRGD